jgi:hypothetical protein
MADTKSDSHAQTTRAHVAHGTDMGAAFLGLIIGLVSLFLLVGSIVMLTNRHYASEKAGAAAER